MLHCHILKILSSKTLVVNRLHCVLNLKVCRCIPKWDSLTVNLEIHHGSILEGTDQSIIAKTPLQD